MNVHFICRGNVLRSLIAETYLRSLALPHVSVSSSGTNVALASVTERQFFADTIALLNRHGMDQFAKNTSDQLTQDRADSQDVTVCMNQRVLEEANRIVKLPHNTKTWGVTDIGEGSRTANDTANQYEEKIFQEIVQRVDQLVTDTVQN